MSCRVLLLTTSDTSEGGGIAWFQKSLHKFCEETNIEVLEKSYKFSSIAEFYLIGKDFINCRNLIQTYRPTKIILNDPHLGWLFWSTLGMQVDVILFSHGWVFHNGNSFFKRTIFNLLTVPLVLFSKRYQINCVSRIDSDMLNGFLRREVVGNPLRFEPSMVDIPDKSTSSFIFVGRDVKHKNIDRLLSFFAENKGLELVLVSKLRYQRNVPENVKVIRDINDVELANLFCASRYFISFSEFEGYGMAIVEAMAFGCLPILFRNKAHEEIVNQSCVGVVFDYENEIIQYLKSTTMTKEHQERATSFASNKNYKTFWKSIIYED
jgi:glycosyltransferase involved in cell wall biosynthesis